MAEINGDPGHAGGSFNLRPGSLSQHHLLCLYSTVLLENERERAGSVGE